jgi:hypothetical protein
MMITPALHITSGQQEVPTPPTSNHQGLLETSATNPSNLPNTITPIKRLKHIKTSISSKPSKRTELS